ncbi:hypothetical protein [Nocardia sp. NPDC051833]|uniref:hypothetical protein n=1 Tax=Nocardia sp. NPDC051833 TaxID=3155674 RepID=UPI00342599D7
MTHITCSRELAALLNDSSPATPEDATETPIDWVDGLWVNGDTYDVDAAATTSNRLAFADGSAAVEWKPAGSDCWGSTNPCGHVPGRPDARERAHWVPASTAEWACAHDNVGVSRDWRTVNVWDANGYTDTTVYDTVAEAEAAAEREVAALAEICSEHHTDED